jgi:class 3 adenylate cyclase
MNMLAPLRTVLTTHLRVLIVLSFIGIAIQPSLQVFANDITSHTAQTEQEDSRQNDSLLNAAVYDYNANKFLEAFQSLIIITKDTITYSSPEVQSAAHNFKGLILLKQANYMPALKEFLDARKYAEQANDVENLPSIIANIASVYRNRGDNEVALEKYYQALELYKDLRDTTGLSKTMNSIGILYDNKGMIDSALTFFNSASRFVELVGDIELEATISTNRALIFQKQKKYDEALKYLFDVFKIRSDFEDSVGLASVHGNIGYIYAQKENIPKALFHLRQALVLSRENGLLREEYLSLRQLSEVYQQMGRYKEAVELITQSFNVRDKVLNEDNVRAVDNAVFVYETERKNAEIDLLENKNRVAQIEIEQKKTEIALATLQQQRQQEQAKAALLLKEQRLKTIEEHRLLEEQEAQVLALQQANEITQLEQQRSADELKILRANTLADNARQAEKIAEERKKSIEKELEKEQLQRNFLLLGLASLVFLLLFFIYLYRLMRQKNKEITEKNDEILKQQSIMDEQAREIELRNVDLQNSNLELEQAHTKVTQAYSLLDAARERSEKLLENTLPISIAEQLKREWKTIVQSSDSVTVVFIDLAGFTVLSQAISPQKIVTILDRIFSSFDELTHKYGIEKIKTIGDSYMAVGGLPEPDINHALNVASFALEIPKCVKALSEELGVDLKVSIGLNSGKAVAGVIGRQKFAYDLWGDTVNTASRMESHGVIGKIHCTEQTMLLLQEYPSIKATDRGVMSVKGKGEMRTFFLEWNK